MSLYVSKVAIYQVFVNTTSTSRLEEWAQSMTFKTMGVCMHIVCVYECVCVCVCVKEREREEDRARDKQRDIYGETPLRQVLFARPPVIFHYQSSPATLPLSLSLLHTRTQPV